MESRDIAGGRRIGPVARPGGQEVRTSTRTRRHPVTRNVNVEHAESLALGERVANMAASIIGSWRFIVVMSFFLAAWISLNVSAWARH